MDQAIQAILKLAAGGGNPMNLIQQFLGSQNNQNPKVAQAMRMIQGKNAKQLEETARNMAKEAGTTPEEILSGLGIPFSNK